MIKLTHKDLSDHSIERLLSLNDAPLVDGVLSCIGSVFQSDTETKSQSTLGYIRKECEELNPPFYLEECVEGDKHDPFARLDSLLRNGWQTGGGLRIPLTVIPDWDSYKSNSRNVRYKIHSWVMLDSLLLVDSLSSENENLLLAVDIADDWIKKYVILSEKDDFAWYDMAVGQRATKLSYMTRRLIEINADSDLIFRFILASEIHFSELSDLELIATHSNHGLFQIAGLISLAKNLPWMLKSEQSLKFAEVVLRKMLDEHFAEDGLHLEHSPDYHLFMVNHLSSLHESGWLSSEFGSITELIEKATNAANWMATPELNVIPIGDTANNTSVEKRWSGFTSEFILGTKLFDIGGLLINNSRFKSLNSQLVFSAQFHSRQHKHADSLNVLYHLNEKPLLVDPGTFTYQYDAKERMYCESTRAHNTVEIDKLNHSRFRHDSFGSAIRLLAKAEGVLISEAVIDHSRLISPEIPNNRIKGEDAIRVKIQHRRFVIERPGHFLAVIDQMSSKEEHEYTAWYHLHPNLSLNKSSQTRLNVSNEDDSVICQIQSYDAASNSLEYVEKNGEKLPRLHGWFSRNGRELVPSTSIGFHFNDSPTIVTLFDFDMRKTGKPYLRVGTGGKYLRFAITQAEKKFDMRMKIIENKIHQIDVQLDGQEINVGIEYGGG